MLGFSLPNDLDTLLSLAVAWWHSNAVSSHFQVSQAAVGIRIPRRREGAGKVKGENWVPLEPQVCDWSNHSLERLWLSAAEYVTPTDMFQQSSPVSFLSCSLAEFNVLTAWVTNCLGRQKRDKNKEDRGGRYFCVEETVVHRTPGMGPECGKALLFSRGDGEMRTQCGELQESLKQKSLGGELGWMAAQRCRSMYRELPAEFRNCFCSSLCEAVFWVFARPL